MKVLGVVLMICGVLIGLYLGIWWAFIGGIVDIVEAARATEVSAMAIALGAVKVLFFEVIGGIPGLIVGGTGYLAYNWD